MLSVGNIGSGGTHGQNTQVSFHRYTSAMVASPINLSSTLGIDPNAIPPLSSSLSQATVCDVALPVPMFSLFNSHLGVRTCGVWLSLPVLVPVLVAENGFELHPHRCEGREHIPFYGCIVFHGVYVPHFLYPVYHWWVFGLVPSLPLWIVLQ